jgi:predicted 3-demethylubiquinone-9 3-methyltransferase (glyoxalase superfamily)
VPNRLEELLYESDPETSQRVFAAMLKMRKIEIAELERAAAGVPA